MRGVLEELMHLNSLELAVFEVVRAGEIKAEQIARKVDRDATSVSRALNTLVKVGLVSREPRCCDRKKGRYFIYSVQPAFRDALKRKLAEFKKRMETEIAKLT